MKQRLSGMISTLSSCSVMSFAIRYLASGYLKPSTPVVLYSGEVTAGDADI